MNDRTERNLKASLLTQYSVTKNRAAKEEALAMLSFERSKLERTNKKYRVTYYILAGFCFLWTLFNISFTGIWVRMNSVLGVGSKDSVCEDSNMVTNALIIIHAVGIIDVVLCLVAGKRESKNGFLLFVGYMMTQLIARIFVYSQYFELPEDSICPFQSYSISRPSTMKALLTAECAGDLVIIVLGLRAVWLLYKVKGIKKLFNIMGKTENIWTV